MKVTLSQLLSFNGGYVDTAGYLALQGLFTAHVTGNFVTLGASLVLGTSGAIAKLLALPTFCIVVVLTRLLGYALPQRSAIKLRLLLSIMLVLLAVGATLAITLGPFKDGDSWKAIVTGMSLVAAMAVQNSVHRIHMPLTPPSTLMTGTSTQIMLDLADRWHGQPKDAAQATTGRLLKLSKAVLTFALGCAGAAVAFVFFGMDAFLLPLIVAICAIIIIGKDAEMTADA